MDKQKIWVFKAPNFRLEIITNVKCQPKKILSYAQKKKQWGWSNLLELWSIKGLTSSGSSTDSSPFSGYHFKTHSWWHLQLYVWKNQVQEINKHKMLKKNKKKLLEKLDKRIVWKWTQFGNKMGDCKLFKILWRFSN